MIIHTSNFIISVAECHEAAPKRPIRQRRVVTDAQKSIGASAAATTTTFFYIKGQFVCDWRDAVLLQKINESVRTID